MTINKNNGQSGQPTIRKTGWCRPAMPGGPAHLHDNSVRRQLECLGSCRLIDRGGHTTIDGPNLPVDMTRVNTCRSTRMARHMAATWCTEMLGPIRWPSLASFQMGLLLGAS